MRKPSYIPFGGIGAACFGFAYMQRENPAFAIMLLVDGLVASGFFYYFKYKKVEGKPKYPSVE